MPGLSHTRPALGDGAGDGAWPALLHPHEWQQGSLLAQVTLCGVTVVVTNSVHIL